MFFSVYCSGSIQKGANDNGKLVWGDEERRAVAEAARPLTLRFLDPADPVELGDALALFGRDMYQVQLADCVIVDARQRRGIGIGVEILASRALSTPLIVVAPTNSYYRMDSLEYRGGMVSDYIHPHLYSLADAIVEGFAQAGSWIKSHARNPRPIKDLDTVHEAIAKYKEELLPGDPSMLDVIQELDTASKR